MFTDLYPWSACSDLSLATQCSEFTRSDCQSYPPSSVPWPNLEYYTRIEQKIVYTHMSKYQELLPNQVEVRRKNEEKRPCLYVYKLTLAAWQDSLQPI